MHLQSSLKVLKITEFQAKIVKEFEGVLSIVFVVVILKIQMNQQLMKRELFFSTRESTKKKHIKKNTSNSYLLSDQLSILDEN